MTFRLETLPLLRGSRRPTLKDSGADEGQWYMDSGYAGGGGGAGGDTSGGDGSGTTGAGGDTSGGDWSGTTDAGGVADGTGSPDAWQAPVTDENGNTTYTDETGTNYCEDAEGNTTVINPDGSGVGYMADGTVYQWDAEGNQVTDGESMGPNQTGDKGSPADPSNQKAKGKAAALAASALDATWKAQTKNPTATAAPKVNTPAILPSGIRNAMNAKSAVASSSTGLFGLSMGTILVLGATGAYLLSKKKG